MWNAWVQFLNWYIKIKRITILYCFVKKDFFQTKKQKTNAILIRLEIIWDEKNVATRTSICNMVTSLFRTSGDFYPGFQSQGGSFACTLPPLCTTDSSDSPVVWHLLTVLRSASMAAEPFRSTYRRVRKHWENVIVTLSIPCGQWTTWRSKENRLSVNITESYLREAMFLVY